MRLDGSGVEDLVTGGLSEAQRLRVVEKELGMTQAALAEAKGALAEASARASEAGALEKEAGMLRARLSEAQQAVANAGKKLEVTESDAQADAAAGSQRCDEAQRALDEARFEANALGSVRKELELQNAAVAEARSGLEQARAAAEQQGAELRAAQAMTARLPVAEAEAKACRQVELVTKEHAAQEAETRRGASQGGGAGIEAGDLQAEVQKLREAARATEAAVAAAATCRMPATS